MIISGCILKIPICVARFGKRDGRFIMCRAWSLCMNMEKDLRQRMVLCEPFCAINWPGRILKVGLPIPPNGEENRYECISKNCDSVFSLSSSRFAQGGLRGFRSLFCFFANIGLSQRAFLFCGSG